MEVCSQVKCIFRLTDLNTAGFDSDHNSHWGRLHKVEDVKIEWHGGLRIHACNCSKGLILLQSHQMKRSPSYLRFSATLYPLRWTRLRPFYQPLVPGTELLVMTFVGKFERPLFAGLE